MTIEEIRAEIVKAAAGDRTLLVSKYVESTGAVKDYVVKLLPPTGYKDMVRASLAILEHPDSLNEFLNKNMPVGAELGDWVIAVSDQIKSFRTTVGLEEETHKRASKQELVYTLNNTYCLRSEYETCDIKTVILKDLEILSSTNHSPEIIERVPKGNIPKLKQHVRNVLPIGRFLGQLNFRPDKVELVRAVAI